MDFYIYVKEETYDLTPRDEMNFDEYYSLVA